MSPRPKPPPGDDGLRRHAEERLREEEPASPEGDPRRILHELQVHQIELEMQNAELLVARTRLEELVVKYADLYDFAPVGYFSLDAAGLIQEVNLQGAAILGVERSNLLRRRFASFVASSDQSAFEDLLHKVFGGTGMQGCELTIETGAKETVWVDVQAKKTVTPVDGRRLCGIAVSEITVQKRMAEAQLRVDELEKLNTRLKNEVSKRRTVEKSLLESRQTQIDLLKESKRMEEELRFLSHQILHTQEEERRRISHDLHDEIAQTLVAINVHLSSLARSAASNSDDFAGKIIETQKMVERSVESVHQFAMRLRPTHLDDLGLVQALRSYFKDFKNRTKIPVLLAVPSGMKALDDNRSVVLYRVAQAALTNVAQHAKATRVKVDIRQTQRLVRMEIHNDGKSFDVKKALYGTKVKRLGLIGMRERVEMVGGKFAIISSPGEGTTIRVTLPGTKTPPATSSASRLNP